MNLWQNPIFLTQRRLAHRAGVVAPMAITLLTGLSLLAALGYNLAQRPPWSKSEEVGRVFFAWLLVLQALILVVGSFSRISRTIVEERKAGLLDSNRLTPLSPQQLGMGYWLGSAARECYAAATLVPIGLAMVLMANLPRSAAAGAA